MGLIDSLGFGKHATFAAEIKIHDLSQVPLRDAKFRVKWHAKNATTHGPAVAQFAESLVNRTDDSHQISSHLAEAGRRLLQPVNALVDSALGEHGNRLETARSHSPGGAINGEGGGGGSRTVSNGSGIDGIRSPDILSPLMSPMQDSTTPNPNRTPVPQSINFTSPFSRTTTQFGSNDDPSLSHRISRSRTGDSLSSSHHHSHSQDANEHGSLGRRRGGGELLHAPIEAVSHHRLEPKGSTNYVPLRSHTATFDRTIICPVQISARQTTQLQKYTLQPSPFRLSIKLEGIDREGHSQPEEKYGELNLDLSQFVGEKPKARKFLLAHCKTNAILNISIKMEFLEGEMHYVAPTLVDGKMAGSPSSKSLSSARNSPSNRSNASLHHSPRKTPSNLSIGFSPSLQMSRSASATSSIASSSTSLNDVSRDGSIRETKQSRGSRRENKVIGPNGRRNGWHPPGSNGGVRGGSTVTSGCELGERNAAQIIDSIFNRQPETPKTGERAWHTHSGRVNGLATPRSGYSDRRSTRRDDRENDNLGVPGENTSRPTNKKAAWSIRSFTRNRGRARSPQRQSSLDAPSLAPSTSTSSSAPNSDAARPHPSFSIHPPSRENSRPTTLSRLEASFGSTASTQRAPSVNRSPRPSTSYSSLSIRDQTPRPRDRTTSYASSVSVPPSSSNGSPPDSPSSSRPRSVRFTSGAPLNDSPPSSRSLSYRNSTDNLSVHSNSSNMAGLGLSASTLATASTGFTTPRSSMERARTPSINSFNSVVTPPSPERTPMRTKNNRTFSSDSWKR